MATIAIDPTEIRPRPADVPDVPAATAEFVRAEPSGRRSAVVAIAGTAVVVCLLAGAGFAAYPHLPHSLSGLGFAGDAPKPKRKEVRIGPLPDMPEIRNGVPEIATKPVRVIGTDGSNAASQKAAEIVPAVTKASTVSNLALAPPPPTPSIQDVLAAEARTSVPAAVAPKAAKAVAAEPSATASIASDAPRIAAALVAVPLPPAAPIRTSAARKPEKPSSPAGAASTTAAAKPAVRFQNGAPPPAPAPVKEAAAEDERVDILGMKLPNGRDLQNAMSSIGDAIASLPQKF